jgi:NAD(P)-dependent dehydrogenase (short-subunit alcohol dehydrogenase family)
VNLAGKVAIITGGGKGIGGVISRRFLKAGADVVVVARTLEPLEAIAEEGRLLDRKVVICQGDASREDVAEDAVRSAVAAFGKIDILVNNTGIEGPNAQVVDVALEDWHHTFAVNLDSAFLFCKKVVPVMKQQQSGSIINLASLAGTKGIICRSPYCASKWAMIGLSRTLACEVGPENIRVNIIVPGMVAGERANKVIRKRAKDFGVTYEEMLDITCREAPLRRLVTQEEIASMAVYLASDEASGITGEEIMVSGGRR